LSLYYILDFYSEKMSRNLMEYIMLCLDSTNEVDQW